MIDQITEQAHSVVGNALNTLGYEVASVDLDVYPQATDAIIATPIAFQIANQHGENPNEVSSELVENMDVSETYFSDVSSTGPYINFYAKDEWYSAVLESSTEADFGSNIDAEPKNLSVEHTSVNPTGPLHVGRVRNSILGDCISNMLEFVGHSVSRDYYVNDAGLQVAMLVWGYNNINENSLPEPETDADDSDLVRYYREASEILDKDTLKEVQKGESENVENSNEYEVIQILLGLESGDDEIQSMVDDVVNKMLNSQLDSLENLGISFDNFTFESEYLDTTGLENLMDSLKESGDSFTENGAWKIDLGDYDIDKDFVFERSNETTLYGTRDILYHNEKIQEYDEGIVILGEDQELQAKSVRAIVDMIGNDASCLPVVHHAFVQTTEGGMSTRQGEGDFLYEVLERAENKAHEAIQNQDVENEGSVVEDVTVGALRYNIVSKKRQQLTTFDVNRAVSVQSQTGPSVQYAYARMNGIIQQATGIEESADVKYLTEDSSYELIEKLSEFPSVISESVDEMDPHPLAVYTKELKESFNEFYRDCPVTNAESPDIASARMAVVSASYDVMETALELLGIPLIEDM